MRYSKHPLKELEQALKETKAAIEQGQRFLEALPRLPGSKRLEKLSDGAAKIIHRFEREVEKLERAQEKKSARRAKNARVARYTTDQ